MALHAKAAPCCSAVTTKMQTADPRENFLTAVKNGKLGILRVQTTREHLTALLGGLEDFESTEEWIYADCLDVLFDEKTNRVSRVRLRFFPEPSKRAWAKPLQLQWADWLELQNYDAVKEAFMTKGLGFRSIRYTDDSMGLLVVKLPATFLILFNERGGIDSLYLDFRHSHSQLVLMRSVESFNL